MNEEKQNPIFSILYKLLRLTRFRLLIIYMVIFISTNAQTIYTPYDELPTIIKSYKPAFDESYPEWGKKLYQYPINFKEICREFDNYIQEKNQLKVH